MIQTRKGIDHTFATCVLVAVAATPSNAQTPKMLQDKLACSTKAATTVKSMPQVKVPDGTLSEAQRAKLRSDLEVIQAAEAKIWEKCWSIEDMQTLGEANFLVPWAESICGGHRTKNYTAAFDQTENAHLAAFFESEQETRRTNATRMQDLAERKRSDEARRFCNGIVDTFGPKGVRWPGLFMP